MSGRRLLLPLAGANAALCLTTGLTYLTVSPTQLTISLLVTLGCLGCAAIISAGVWQERAKTSPGRRLALLMLAALAGAYSVASVLGFKGAGVAHSARLEPTGLPRDLHAAGVLSGLLLMVVSAAYARKVSNDTGLGSRQSRSAIA